MILINNLVNLYCRIPDPEASKPEDWDEDAPAQIEDPEAEKPEGWLDDEPAEIDDPGRDPFTLHSCVRSVAVVGPRGRKVQGMIGQ